MIKNKIYQNVLKQFPDDYLLTFTFSPDEEVICEIYNEKEEYVGFIFANDCLFNKKITVTTCI